MSKFTPGPWTLNPYNRYDDPRTFYDVSAAMDSGYVATIATVQLSSGLTLCGEGKTKRWEHPALANGRLIAAAPEMIHELKIAQIALSAKDTLDPIHRKNLIERIESLIAKATGGTP